MKTFLAILITLSCAVFAAGTMKLEGTVHGFTAETLDLNDGHKIYTLERSKIPQQDLIKKLKSGTKLALSVPFDAIKDVKPAKK